MFYVLVLIMLASPDDRALFSADGLTPVVFETMPECLVEGRKQGLMLAAARVPARLVCVPGVLDGGIIKGKPPTVLDLKKQA